jgi:hypothetical protein
MKNLLILAFYLFTTITYANELNYQLLKKPTSSPSMACDFIFDHYPDIKFCTVIYNKSHQTLHVIRDDGMAMDLDPTLTGIFFEKVEIDKRYFTIRNDASGKIIVMPAKNREGIKCKDSKSNIENSFICQSWV